MATKWIAIQSNVGEAIAVGDHLVVPIARSVHLAPPGLPAGLVWNRPAAVVIQAPDGTQQVIEVRDITRRIQWTLLGIGLIISLLGWLVSGKNDKEVI